MPFDIDKTLHVFTDREDGGVKQVVVRDSADAEQIGLIQAHLQEEAERFQRGDFSGPEHIHGADMPGMQTLAENADELDVRYRPLPDGGEIRYTTNDEVVVEAHAIARDLCRT